MFIDEYIKKAKEGLNSEELAVYFNMPKNRLKSWRKEQIRENEEYIQIFKELDKFRRVKTCERNMMINKKDSDIVDNIIQLYKQGHSFSEITDILKIRWDLVRKIKDTYEKMNGKIKREKVPKKIVVEVNIDEDLYFQYKEQGLDDTEMEEVLGFSKTHIKLWKKRKCEESKDYKDKFAYYDKFRKTQTCIKRRKYDDIIISQVKELYDNGMQRKNIAQQLGISVMEVKYIKKTYL